MDDLWHEISPYQPYPVALGLLGVLDQVWGCHEADRAKQVLGHLQLTISPFQP